MDVKTLQTQRQALAKQLEMHRKMEREQHDAGCRAEGMLQLLAQQIQETQKAEKKADPEPALGRQE